MVKPTPTQAENDAAAEGQHVMNKELDGSPIDEGVHGKTTEADKPAAAYQTRQMRPAPAPPPKVP
jgi:hypothetical protein